ncbi:MAG: glycosyltransferase family 39 protein [Spirochaetales bacterium]|nr:glycosyltransferase family 39 protein [Spirochaetales bacterium]
MSIYYVYLLELNFLLLIIALIVNFKYIKNIFKETGKKTVLVLLVLAIIGIGLTSFLTTGNHRSYYDEDIYNSIGQNIAQHKRAVMCNEGYYENRELKVVVEEYNKQPAGYPYVISIIFRLFGTSESFIFIFNNCIFGLTIILVFLISFLLFNNTFAGITASLTYMLIPANIQWFNTCSVEPSAAFFAGLAVLSVLLYIKNKKPVNLFLLAASLAFSFSFRTESIILFAVILLILLLKDIRVFFNKYFYIFGLLFFILCTGILFHLLSVQGNDWGSNGEKFSINYFSHNMGINSIFYVNNVYFPVLYTLLGITGLLFYKNRECLKEKLIVLSWFVISWGIYIFFYAGFYSYNSWLSIRFSLLSHIPISLLAGLGISFIYNLLKEKIKYSKSFLVILIILDIFFFFPFIRSEAKGEGELCRMDHKYAMEFIELMPENSIIYTHNPNMFLLHKQSAVQTSSETYRPGIIEYHRQRFNGNVYIHFNYWSNVSYNTLQREFTQNILNKYDYEIIKEYFYKSQKFGLYKIIGLRETK